jgi:tetratricopeptide (TPR) repeat protein
MNVHVIQDLARFLQYSGRIEEGLDLMKRAVAADPLNPATRASFGWKLYQARRFQRALEEANRIVERDPAFAYAYDLLGSSHRALGDLDASHKAYRHYMELAGRPAWFQGAFDRGYEQGGFNGAWGELLAAIRQHDDGSISHRVRASIACWAEEPKEALVELNQAVRKRDPKVIQIGTWPELDCVRSDPRFQDLLRKINWPGLEE